MWVIEGYEGEIVKFPNIWEKMRDYGAKMHENHAKCATVGSTSTSTSTFNVLF